MIIKCFINDVVHYLSILLLSFILLLFINPFAIAFDEPWQGNVTLYNGLVDQIAT